jgi:hypothetical protein
MGQNITKFFAGLLAPKAVTDVLDNQDPKSLAKDCAIGLRNMVISQIGSAPYNKLRTRLISWLDAFYMAFRKEL